MSDNKPEDDEFTDDQAEINTAGEQLSKQEEKNTHPESDDRPDEDTEPNDAPQGSAAPGNAASGNADPENIAPGNASLDTAFEKNSAQPESPDLSIIGDIPVLLTLEVGNKEMTISEVSSLRAGSIVTLQHKESEPLDVKANGVLIAKGEVVLAGDYYGVRILSLTRSNPSEFQLSP